MGKHLENLRLEHHYYKADDNRQSYPHQLLSRAAVETEEIGLTVVVACSTDTYPSCGKQKQINDLKAVLGGKYYDLYKDTASPEPELQETLDAIRYHEQKAMDLEKQAADVRQNTSSVSLKAQPGSGYGEFKSGSAPGNKFCTQCGAPLVEGQAFCVKCGAKI